MMKNSLSKSLKMTEDDDDEELKNCETEKGGSGKRRTIRNESEKRRRDKLNIYITELASMVPTCASSQKKLDKTTILKMTVNYMRIHNDLTGSVLGKEYGLHMSFLSSDEVADLLDESLNGFLFVLSRTGDIVHLSSSITPLLGYEVDQLVGKNFLDIVHTDDKSLVLYELNEDKTLIIQSELNGFRKLNNKPKRHSFDIRIACLRDHHYNNEESYEMVHVVGYIDSWEVKKSLSKDTMVGGCKTVAGSEQTVSQIITEKPHFFVAVGLLRRQGLKRFMSIDERNPVEFESRHTMDGKFLFVDPRSITMTGFWPYELLGTSLYAYVHHDDMQMLASVHQFLFEYGECKTEPYRVRSKGDQWLWMKSRSFISYNHWNSKPEFFCSTNVAVCNEHGMESLREREKAMQCSTQQVDTSDASLRNSLYPYHKQQESNLMLLKGLSGGNNVATPVLSVQQADVAMTTAGCKVVGPSDSDSSNGSNIPNSTTSSSHDRSLSLGGSRSLNESDGADSESTDSMDLSMSLEELEGFIEAQGQLHDQLMTKHALLEQTIAKQRQQLQAVQQQMLLNLQAQLTLNPGGNQEMFEEQFKKTKKFSELHEKQQASHKDLVQTLKERRRQTEKRNQKQLKYFLEKKKMKIARDVANDGSSLSGASVSESINSSVMEEKQFMNSSVLSQEQLPRNQVENIREGNQNQTPVISMQTRGTVQYPVSGQDSKQSSMCYASDGRQPVADGQWLSRSTTRLTTPFIPEQQGVQRGFLSSQESIYQNAPELTVQRREQNFTPQGKTNMSNLNASGFSLAVSEPPTTLSNIQNLLTASSQNPKAMQNLLSGLSSQPEVAQTLLNLLKQAQASGSNEQDSLLFDQSLQRTTNQFSAALNTGVNRDGDVQMSYQYGYSIANLQGLQNQQQASLGEASTSTLRRNTEQQVHSRTRTSTSSCSTSTWSGSLSGESSSTEFLHGQTSRHLIMERKQNEKQKENKKDYFSNFTSQELEAMFINTPPKVPPSSSAQSTSNVEEAKLTEEELLHSPLLIQQQQLLQMHQDQRQLLVRQQEQLLMASQQKPNQTQQQMNVSFAESSQQDSLRSLLSQSNQQSTSTAGQEQQSLSGNPNMSQSSAAWDALSSNNFELNEADEQVLNMLLAESSMDTLLDPSPWPETDNLLEYLNMNPDLTSD